MTNPNNAIGTNAAFGGRTSVNAFNDNLTAWTRGIMRGWACVPDSGMTIALGGDPDVRDVAVAEDDAGNRTTINNISLAPIQITIAGAPASNARIDSIVAYVDNPPQGSATITDNYEACGIIVVSGTATASPVAPSEATIRTAITADGATGSTAYYVVLANITVASGTTDITAGEITAGDASHLSGAGMVTDDNIALRYEIIAAGQYSFNNIPSNSSLTQRINIPDQPDTNYIVLITHQSTAQAFSFVMPATSAKYTNYFNLIAWNNHSSVASATLGYAVIRINQ